ncbi:dTDP-4-dehydrorhamnose 3,5-epimerase family protein [Candidatus Collierbacteria bacterium]|nr:dTDP-4-dehydrorhamnose 3,5-epimerase family protein [Candidatus Collierbacteria bacterium]
MDKNSLSDKYAKLMTTQEYGKNQPIEGVKFIPLAYHRDDTGEFSELGRVTEGVLQSVEGFKIAQISYSLLLPKAVKAFHLHFNQTDAWYVSPYDRLLVGLLDTRKHSKTADKTMRLILGAGVAQLLIIPPGVAHGAANPWDKPTSMVYFTDKQFSPIDPDELRIPHDSFGEDFWKLTKG